MSDYTSLRDALAERIKALVGVTLPTDAAVFKGMSPERFAQEAKVLALNVRLTNMTAGESELLGDAVFQPEMWEWAIDISSMGATAHDDGADRTWSAVEAVRESLVPYGGWRPDAVADVVMFVGVAPIGWTSSGAAIFSAQFKHARNLG